MLKDAYKGIRSNYIPTQKDIDSYRKVLDRNGDGDVTHEDLDVSVQRYFCTEDDMPDTFSRRDIMSTRYI